MEIEARQLTVQFGARTVLTDITFGVRAGEVYGIVGAPSAGKTTLVNVFAGFVRPTKGQALVHQRDVTNSAAGGRPYATFISQDSGLDPALTALQNVELFGASAGVDRRTDTRIIKVAMRRAGIPERAFDKVVRDLDRTIEVLLLISIAFLRESSAVIADDPAAGLDPKGARDVQECLKELQRDGKALLITATDPAFIQPLANRVSALRDGILVTDGEEPPRPVLRTATQPLLS